ncbi:MAG: hypothetical protein JRE18_00905 [Deltaproteobacteria bacterium]|jgi:hypothetical protein|nr:hypothetical protein [Deltaproteobacteria bacterium]
MTKYQQVGGLYQVPLTDFGKALQKQGWTVKEHSAFGGVTPGVHSEKGHHPHDEALDITWWKSDTDPSGKMGWKDYTQNLGERLGQLKGANNQYLQALHPGNEPRGHGTHAHLGVTGGVLALTPQQMQDFGLSNVDLTQTTSEPKPTTTVAEPTKTVPSQQQPQLPVNIFITTPTTEKRADDFLSSYISSNTFNPLYQSRGPTFDPMALMATLSKTTKYS